jgi:hypothetical protein
MGYSQQTSGLLLIKMQTTWLQGIENSNYCEKDSQPNFARLNRAKFTRSEKSRKKARLMNYSKNSASPFQKNLKNRQVIFKPADIYLCVCLD